MKKLIYSFLAITLLLFSCEKEEIATLEIADFMVHVGGQAQTTAFNIAIDDYITFINLSRNVTQTEWKIDAGNFYISDEFTDADSIYTEFILEGAGEVSMDKKVNVLFTKAGLQPVQIITTFDKEPVSKPITTTQQGGNWLVDTTYMIDVFADLQPSFKVYKGDEEVISVSAGDLPDPSNSSTWPVVEVEAGQSLTFVDLTTIGRPNRRTWNLEGSIPAITQDSAATVSYFSLGTYLGGNFTSVRDGSRPQQTFGKTVPVQIKVIPSSEPFLYEGNLKELSDETIVFNVGGELQEFSGLEASFTVNVTNDSAGYSQDIPVSVAKVSESDATQIELKLSDALYNSDNVTISYSGTEIKSADFRTLSDFGPETVIMHFEESLLPTDWAGFETADANWKKAFCFGFWVGNSNGSADLAHFSRTEDLFASGAASMKLDLFNGVETKLLQGGDFKNFGLEAGSYVLKMKIFLEPDNVLTTLQTIVQEPFTVINWDITDAPRGEWIELSAIASFEAAPTKRYDFKIDASVNPTSSDPQVLFIDDYEFIPLEVR